MKKVSNLKLTNGELSFREWMDAIDEILISIIGLSTDDLPDMPYMIMYESGSTVEEIIEEIREENDFFGELD